MSLIEQKNVTKSFGGVQELKDVNLSVAQGEIVAIVGFSGAGKTTLVSIIAGLLKPDSGAVLFEGREMDGPGPDRGLVFQNYSLLPWLTVFENVKLAVDQVLAGKSEAERVAHTEEFVEMVNLTPARNKRPGELSGGMRQRVSVARTLAMQPKVLLCDEPLGALDALTRANLQDEIARIRKLHNQTIVLITNDPDEGIYLADRIIPLTAGPGATLGPSFTVDIPHPRDRKAVNHDDHFKQLRFDVTAFLLGSKQDRNTTITRQLVLPDVEPEDLNIPRSMMNNRRLPRRSSEVREEKVGVDA